MSVLSATRSYWISLSPAIEAPWEQFLLSCRSSGVFLKGYQYDVGIDFFLKSRNQRTQMLPIPEEQTGVRQMECTVLSGSQLTHTEHEGKER